MYIKHAISWITAET